MQLAGIGSTVSEGTSSKGYLEWNIQVALKTEMVEFGWLVGCLLKLNGNRIVLFCTIGFIMTEIRIVVSKSEVANVINELNETYVRRGCCPLRLQRHSTPCRRLRLPYLPNARLHRQSGKNKYHLVSSIHRFKWRQCFHFRISGLRAKAAAVIDNV